MSGWLKPARRTAPVALPRTGKSRLGLGRLIAFIILVCVPAAVAFAHGAWLGRPTIYFTPATDAQITANVSAGKGAIVAGDIVELIAEFPAIVSGTLSGPSGYFTFYVPGGTEVVGASVVDSSLNDIPVRKATSAVTGEGISRGWGPRGANTFTVGATGWNPSTLDPLCTLNLKTAATCSSSLAHIYGDTGIFYSTRADTAFYTGDGTDTATLTNGYQIRPSNTTPWSSIGGTGNARVHNKWDAVQSNAFGSGGPLVNPGFTITENTRIVTGGQGSVPYKTGSPVAGPLSGNNLDRYATTGPWQRISYAGACLATDGLDGPANNVGTVFPQPSSATPTSVAVCTSTAAGSIVSTSSPLPAATNAVRYSIGGIDQGRTYRIKLRLRVIDPTLIKAFNAEAAGGDSTQGVQAGNDNPWRYFVGGPGISAPGVAGRLAVVKSIVAVNGSAYSGTGIIPPNATVRYRIGYANTSLTPQTNVQLSDVLPTQATSTSNFAIIAGPSIIPASPPATGTVTFTSLPTLGALAGGAVEFDVKLTAAVGATITNTARILSTQHPTLLTHAVSAAVALPVSDLRVAKNSSLYDPLSVGKYSLPGEDVVYSITVTNRGDAVSSGSLIVIDALPANLSFSRFAFDGTTTEPIKFVDGTTTASSGLTCCDSTNIQYSTDGGVSYSYLPPASQYDNTITYIRVVPTGQMRTGITSPTSFELRIKARIK